MVAAPVSELESCFGGDLSVFAVEEDLPGCREKREDGEERGCGGVFRGFDDGSGLKGVEWERAHSTTHGGNEAVGPECAEGE